MLGSETDSMLGNADPKTGERLVPSATGSKTAKGPRNAKKGREIVPLVVDQGA